MSVSLWAYREVARIEALPKVDLILEINNAMNGYTYSWTDVGKALHESSPDKALQLDWEDLCRLKRTWDSFEALTRDRRVRDITAIVNHNMMNPEFLRVLLVNLRLILIRAGIEENKAVSLVCRNDSRALNKYQDLCKDHERWSVYFKEWAQEVDEKAPLLQRCQREDRQSKQSWSWRDWIPFL